MARRWIAVLLLTVVSMGWSMAAEAEPKPSATTLPAGLRIDGLSAFPVGKARDAVGDQWQEIVRRGLSPSRANDAAYLLNLALRRNGFTKSHVDWRQTGPKALTLVVVEGPRRMLGTVTILGAKALDKDLLKQALIGDLQGRQSLLNIDAKLPFVRQALTGGVSAIESYAIYEGHLQATAELTSTEANARDPNKIDVTVTVFEGPKFIISEVTVEGAEGLLRSKLKKAAEPFPKKPWNSANTRELHGALANVLRDRGYHDAEVILQEGANPSLDHPQTEVPIRVQVVPGQLYRVEAITVSGEESLHQDFVKKRFRHLLGEAYDPAEVRRVFRDLAQTGLFDDVEIVPEPIDTGKIRLEVQVEEAKHKAFGLYGGFGSFDGPILGVTHTNRNLLGTGRSLRSQLEVNGRGVQGEIDYLDRWLLDSSWQFDARVFSGTRFLEGYDKWEVGARISLAYPVSDHTRISLFGEWTRVNLIDNDFVDANIGPSSYTVQTVGVALTWDHRHDLERRGHGYVLETSLDYATPLLDDQVHFVRGSFQLSHYWRVFEDSELRLGVRAGAMLPLGDAEQVPLDLRFFNGGSRSVRSFPERELGPSSRGNPLGGEFYSVVNVEYAVPIFDGFQVAVFADAGNVLSEAEDASFDDMHYAAGLGLRYDLPVGPLRLDYGYNLNRQPGEPWGAFHVAFGFAF